MGDNMTFNTCSFCGSDQHLSLINEQGWKGQYVCAEGECNMELERELRDAHQQEYEDQLDALNREYWQ